MSGYTFASINSSSIAFATDLFYAFYVIEIIFHISAFFVAPVVVFCVWTTKVLHVNFRLRWIFHCVGMLISVVCRFNIIRYQLYDIPQSDEDIALFVTNVVRSAYFTYFCFLLTSVGCERVVAIFFWKWYEKGSKSTILLFIAMETVVIIYSFTYSYLFIIGDISERAGANFQAVISLIGSTSFIAVLKLNHRAVFGNNHRSLAKTFQLRENSKILNLMGRLLGVTSIVIVIAFINQLLFVSLPESAVRARPIVQALFNLSVAISDNVCYASIFFMDRTFIAKFKALIEKATKVHPAPARVNPYINTPADETEMYFAALAQAWDQPLSATQPTQL